MAGIYIHIPFCASRCIYCDFYSTTTVSLQDQYTEALCKEMELRKHYLSDLQADLQEPTVIDTLYFGGGTPSQLSADNFRKIFQSLQQKIFSHPHYRLSPHPEITVECNPDDITGELLHTLKSLSVNRISMGVQTFSDERLKFLRRRHTSQEVYHAIDLIRQHEIDNISIDLIFGFPKQTLAEWEEDLQQAINLDVQHISAYSLMYEEGTPLYKMLTTNKVEEIDEKLSLAMFNTLINTMVNNGFEHYEISNFAKPNYRSQHNSSYWKNTPYLGLGVAAHSYNLSSRQWNVSHIKKYIQSLSNNEVPAEIEPLDDTTRYNDLIATALRTKEGICLDRLDTINKEFLLKQAQKHLEQQTLMINNGCLSLTREGIYISDSIMADLIKV